MNYYNDNDPGACAWLRGLMADGLISEGVVDDRSICDVRPEDLRGFERVSLFSGIAGWDLALQFAGWPAGRPVWSISCPCQPFSAAGKGEGGADDRHLWPVVFRLICECKPECIVFEQVESAIGHGWLDRVLDDLEGEGFACWAVVLPAASVGAPHIRSRIFGVAVSGYRGEPLGSVPGSREGASASRSGASDQFGGSGHTDDLRMGEPIRSRLQGHPGDGDFGGESGRVGAGPDRSVAEAGAVERVEFAAREQVGIPGRARESGAADRVVANPEGRGEGSERGVLGRQVPESDGGFRLDESNRSGRQERQPSSETARYGSSVKPDGCAFWADFDIVPCADGKSRRVISGTQLVAHGLPADVAVLCDTKFFPKRAALLKGAGNAIVPQVAAEFIRAFLEVR